MPINSTNVGIPLMNVLLNGTNMTALTKTPYLGLFTVMPGVNMTGGSEIEYPEYVRVDLSAKGVGGSSILVSPYAEDDTDADGNPVKAVKVHNQEIIYFPENETGANSTIVGWGLFTSKDATTPYMSGYLKNPIEVKTNTIPMIRINNMTLGVK